VIGTSAQAITNAKMINSGRIEAKGFKTLLEYILDTMGMAPFRLKIKPDSPISIEWFDLYIRAIGENPSGFEKCRHYCAK
jgi:hypothetical protein